MLLQPRSLFRNPWGVRSDAGNSLAGKTRLAKGELTSKYERGSLWRWKAISSTLMEVWNHLQQHLALACPLARPPLDVPIILSASLHLWGFFTQFCCKVVHFVRLVRTLNLSSPISVYSPVSVFPTHPPIYLSICLFFCSSVCPRIHHSQETTLFL